MVVQCLEFRGELEVGFVEAEVAVAQRWFRQRREVVGVEAVEVFRRPLGAFVDPVAHDLEVRPTHVQRLGVLLDPLDLRRRLRVAAELERHQDLVEPPAGVRIVDGGRGLGRGEGGQGREVEVGTVPEIGDDRTEHRELLVGGAAVDVDGAEEALRHRFHQRRGDEEGHQGEGSGARSLGR